MFFLFISYFFFSFLFCKYPSGTAGVALYEGWNFNNGNYLFTTDTK